MKYYEQLLKMEVFNFEDVKKLTGSADSAKNLLGRYVKKGFVKKIKRNLYYCNNLENKNSAADRFVIGSNINDTSFISYHSAFEYHGVSNQVFNKLYISSDKMFRSFDFEDITYKFVKSGFNNGIIVPETNLKIRVSNLERTVIDCIKNLSLAGGTEELFECLNLILFLDSEKITEYLDYYNIKFLYQKAGYIFEKYQRDLRIEDYLLARCLDNIGGTVRYFDNDSRNGNGLFVKRWNLIVPDNIENFLGREAKDFA